jgi:putative transposase
VPGIAFCALSLVSGHTRRSFPVRVEQGVRSAAEKAARQAKAAAKKSTAPHAPRRRGRPPGRTNQPKAHATLTPELTRINAMRDALLALIARVGPLPYVVLEGHFGNHNALHRAQQGHLPLMSKLRCEAALYFPYTGPSAGRGPRRT